MSETVNVEIMGEKFQVQCSPENKANLIKAAEMLHDAMKQINQQGTAFSLNRIAVMAALNIANDAITGNTQMASMIRTEYDSELDLSDIQKKLNKIHSQVENSLNSDKDLKLQ
tara:strand:- start:1 stop:339 length:339 start_codon:yes stop_codon:yes gene_type:complete